MPGKVRESDQRAVMIIQGKIRRWMSWKQPCDQQHDIRNHFPVQIDAGVHPQRIEKLQHGRRDVLLVIKAFQQDEFTQGVITDSCIPYQDLIQPGIILIPVQDGGQIPVRVLDIELVEKIIEYFVEQFHVCRIMIQHRFVKEIVLHDPLAADLVAIVVQQAYPVFHIG